MVMVLVHLKPRHPRAGYLVGILGIGRIPSLLVVIKRMGNLLTCLTYLPLLPKVIVIGDDNGKNNAMILLTLNLSL